MDKTAQDILTFWFGTADLSTDIKKNDLWFKATPEFDEELVEKFVSVHERAASGDMDHLRETPAECLALVISLDQFPRNIYRGTGKAFHTDAKACATSHFALKRITTRRSALNRENFSTCRWCTVRVWPTRIWRLRSTGT